MSSADTRETLLRAAWRLMKEDAASASMARIAKEAGVSRQTVYLHFESRAGLLLALVRWTDEREKYFERLAPLCDISSPLATLEAYVRAWLDYLPRLHPVPGYLARAKHDVAAASAWTDRMRALERVYRKPLSSLHSDGRLHEGLDVRLAIDAVRATASVHAWEHLVHDRRWSQKRAVDCLWRAACAAVLKP